MGKTKELKLLKDTILYSSNYFLTIISHMVMNNDVESEEFKKHIEFAQKSINTIQIVGMSVGKNAVLKKIINKHNGSVKKWVDELKKEL